jgi:hypothetical protein
MLSPNTPYTQKKRLYKGKIVHAYNCRYLGGEGRSILALSEKLTRPYLKAQDRYGGSHL